MAYYLMFLIFGLFVPKLAAQLSQEEQNYCANSNNDLRRQLANGNQQNKSGMLPPATNILQMSYNTTTGQTAQTWADQCQFVHSNAPGLGENIFYSTKEGMSNTEAVDEAFAYWWGEAKKVGIPENLVVDANNFEPIGHFTQMAWHSSTDLGCGVANCPNSPSWKTFVVCNYWPPGNSMGETIYGAGATCSACDQGWKCDNAQKGLCVRGDQ